MNKNYFYMLSLTIVCAVLGFLSCEEKDDTEPFKSKEWVTNYNESNCLSQTVYNSELISFKDGEYQIKSKKQYRGVISDSAYKITYDAVESMNSMLALIKRDLVSRGYNVTFVDCSYGLTPNLSQLEKMAPTESDIKPVQMPRGKLESDDNSTVYGTFTAPYGQAGVYANCFAKVALGAGHAVTTTYAHKNAQVGTRLGNGSITVPIPMSNTIIGIEYRTTDANGGKCSWVGVTSIK